MFLGNLRSRTSAGKATLTRANGSDLGSFIDEGFAAGQLIQIGGAGAGYDGNYYVATVTDAVLTLDTRLRRGDREDRERRDAEPAHEPRPVRRQGHGGGRHDLARLHRRRLPPPRCSRRRREPDGDDPGRLARGRLPRGPARRGLRRGDDTARRFKIAIIRGDNETKDNKLEFTAENAFPVAWTNGALLDVKVTRLAAIATFDDENGGDPNWYTEQQVVLVADLALRPAAHARRA